MSRILVVDDEKILSQTLARVLIKSSYNVTTANNGVEAISIIRDNSCFDLVFLDLLMPEVGGAEVLDFIKARCPQSKVIMMTAYGDSSVLENLITRGAFKILSKPFDDIFQISELAKNILSEKTIL